MARIFTTPEAEKTAKILMHDITVASGINSNNLRPTTPYSLTRTEYITAAQTICDELTKRDFADIDNAIVMISNFRFIPNYDGLGSYKSIKPAAIAKCIVYMAELLQLYWDDTIRTPFEVDEFKKTLLGKAVYKYGRYISAIPAKKSRSTSGSAATKTPGQPPKNSYKSSGPQSGNARDLRDPDGSAGTPGVKVTANGPLIYKIIGDKIGQSTPNAFIKPLNPNGAAGSTNKVFIGSGKGYGECTCFFDDPNDAKNFLDAIIKSNRVPSNVANLRIVKSKADSNGYFLVGTEFGVCAIVASKLNEELVPTEDELTGWDKATKGYSNEKLEELHTWMRRG